MIITDKLIVVRKYTIDYLDKLLMMMYVVCESEVRKISGVRCLVGRFPWTVAVSLLFLVIILLFGYGGWFFGGVNFMCISASLGFFGLLIWGSPIWVHVANIESKRYRKQ